MATAEHDILPCFNLSDCTQPDIDRWVGRIFCRRAASNVKVQEPEWDEQLFRTEGDLEATFDSVPAGSTKSFKFMVTPKVKLQRFDQPSTEVTYEDNGKAVSTNGPTLYLQTFKAEDILLMKALNIGGYISLGMLTTGAQWARASIMCAGSFAVYVVINLVRKLKTMSQESKRKRALRELLKEE